MSTNFKNNTITITPIQLKILQWMSDKGSLTETEAMEQGLGRMGISRQAVRNSLIALTEAGLVKRKRSSRTVNGVALDSNKRKIQVFEYMVKQ